MFSFFLKFSIFFFFFISTLFADTHILEQENFEAWQYTCVAEQNQKICDLREFVLDSNTNEVVSYLSITINPEKLTQMQIAFPHAVNLKSPIKFQIDDENPIDLNYIPTSGDRVIADNGNGYKLGEKIAEGGEGAIYKFWQDQPYRKSNYDPKKCLIKIYQD